MISGRLGEPESAGLAEGSTVDFVSMGVGVIGSARVVEGVIAATGLKALGGSKISNM